MPARQGTPQRGSAELSARFTSSSPSPHAAQQRPIPVLGRHDKPRRRRRVLARRRPTAPFKALYCKKPVARRPPIYSAQAASFTQASR